LRRALERVIEEYNRFRSPEATARLLRLEGSRVEIEFEGPFCLTCGVLDWVEDLKYVAMDLGLELELLEVNEIELGRLRAVFRVLKGFAR